MSMRRSLTAMALSDRLRYGNSGHWASQVRQRSSLVSVGGSAISSGVGNSLPMARCARSQQVGRHHPIEDAPALLVPATSLLGREHR